MPLIAIEYLQKQSWSRSKFPDTEKQTWLNLTFERSSRMPLSQDVPVNQRYSVLMGPAPLRLGIVSLSWVSSEILIPQTVNGHRRGCSIDQSIFWGF
jgi:hypothetical protein